MVLKPSNGIDQFEPAVFVFNDSGTALDPIPAVHIQNRIVTLGIPDLGLMDMPADDTIESSSSCFVCEHMFKLIDVFTGGLDTELDELAE